MKPDWEESLEKRPNKDTLTEIHKIDKEIGTLKQLKIKLQSECKHENARFTYSSDTGNWCRDDDTYWKDWYCPDCTKSWTETT